VFFIHPSGRLQHEISHTITYSSDYEEFRKTGRIITRAMEEGGSEIWLSPAEPPVEGSELLGDQWWHKFGHSRRGLEHVVSVEEGRQRQVNVRQAIHAVLQEQARQCRRNAADSEKLRSVSLHFTTWAKDLALAAGASDADAVTTEFSTSRKSREFYLLQMKGQTSLRPQFMQPPASVGSRLDNHKRTPSQITATAATADLLEPLRDPDPLQHTQDSLANRAKGIGGDRVDASAVLSGMGAVSS
jgi:hypothetical protein